MSIRPNHVRYIGFYTSLPFWAEASLDVDKLIHTPNSFTDEMSKEVFQEINKDFELKVCRDGMILFRLNQLAEESEDPDVRQNLEGLLNIWSEYLNYANAFVLMLESAFLQNQNFGYFQHRELTNKDAFVVTFENGKWSGQGVPTLSIAKTFQDARFPSLLPALGVPPSMNHAFMGRVVVPRDTLDAAVGLLSKCYQSREAIALMSQISKSLSEYKIGNFATSLVLSWFVIESIVDSLWRQWLKDKNTLSPEDGLPRISAKRLERLNGRDYPVSVRLNLLELNGYISLEEYKTLNEIRGYRNKVVHQEDRYSCSMKHATLAIEAANNLIEKSF